MPDDPAGPSARRTGVLMRPAILVAVLTAFVAGPQIPPLLPPGCAIGWTMVGGVLMFVPDCTHRSQAPPPPPTMV
ncbi:hypothetical protein, partial [Mycobacterium sp. E2497]|uniref:hypothetical protein n=1 Tax=Mycobacterium sp. E2497 TaxID=1834135 RepID=UPI000AD4FCA1